MQHIGPPKFDQYWGKIMISRSIIIHTRIDIMTHQRMKLTHKLKKKLNTKWPHWRLVNISSGNGFVPIGNKPLPEPMSTQIYVAIWHHYSTYSAVIVVVDIWHWTQRQPQLSSYLHPLCLRWWFVAGTAPSFYLIWQWPLANKPW